MSETKFTPGPWRADGPDMFGDYNILHPADSLAVAAAVTNLRLPEEVEANARLIAAAPEMYEALAAIIEKSDDFLSTMGPNWEGDPLSDACTAAKAVLAKAEGRS